MKKLLSSNKCFSTTGTINVECLEERAEQLAAFSTGAATAGNTIAVFSMLVLQEILEEESVNPVANLANIILITNSIAALNASIKSLVP